MNNFRSPALISSPAAYNTKIKKKDLERVGIECYESFTDFYSQVCKYKAIFKIIRGHKYCQIHYAYAQKLKELAFKVKTSISTFNLTVHIFFFSSIRAY